MTRTIGENVKAFSERNILLCVLSPITGPHPVKKVMAEILAEAIYDHGNLNLNGETAPAITEMGFDRTWL